MGSFSLGLGLRKCLNTRYRFPKYEGVDVLQLD